MICKKYSMCKVCLRLHINIATSGTYISNILEYIKEFSYYS